MLISSPFLSGNPGDETDSAWLDTIMRENAHDGTYPVGRNLCWHGGIHLEAPIRDNRSLPVRAIADGRVIFCNTPQPEQLGNPNHPLAYDNGWTSNGAVIIAHDADIGVEANDTVVTVRFYSLYHHLSSINVQQGAVVSRKDLIGEAGFIAGIANQIHFEIVCNDVNLQRLIGRTQGDLDTTTNGRTDVVFGEIYVKLPAGTPVYNVPNGRRLLHNNLVAHTRPVPGNGAALPLQPTAATAADYYIGLRYAMGEGAIAQRGDLTVTTYDADGTIVGSGAERNGEYNVYSKVREICNDIAEATRPSMYFVFELLRFGRVISNEADAPNLENVPHWRQVCLPDGVVGWVNLNNQQGDQRTTVFSDADFPQWRWWKLIDDDTSPNDNRCDSPSLNAIFDENGDGEITREELRNALTRRREEMRHMICSMPSEWNAATIEARWSWLRTATEENNHQALTDDDFTAFSDFVRALCLNAPADFLAARWRFHPRAFIEIFRKCGWLTESQLRDIYPASTAENRTRYLLAINKCCRKYFLTRLRAGNFFGQSLVESSSLRDMVERHNGPDPFVHFRRYERARNYTGWLGNILWNDGGNFRGRGFKQLTGRYNYVEYWLYRGWLLRSSYRDEWWRNVGWWGIQGDYVRAQHQDLHPIQNQPEVIAQLTQQMRPPNIVTPERAATDTVVCVDTACWFWAKNSIMGNNQRSLLHWANQNHHIWATRIIRGDSEQTTPTEQAYEAIAGAHFARRRDESNRIRRYLGDEP